MESRISGSVAEGMISRLFLLATGVGSWIAGVYVISLHQDGRCLTKRPEANCISERS